MEYYTVLYYIYYAMLLIKVCKFKRVHIIFPVPMFILSFQYSSLVLKDATLSYMLFMSYNDKTEISSKILEELTRSLEVCRCVSVYNLCLYIVFGSCVYTTCVFIILQYSSLVLKDENLSYMLFMFYNDKTDISDKILEELKSAAEGFKDKVPYKPHLIFSAIKLNFCFLESSPLPFSLLLDISSINPSSQIDLGKISLFDIIYKIMIGKNKKFPKVNHISFPV